ncbi:hypothetical protein A2U01_0119554, partial [Trifolium medium]|nr:hypothetical protein [Trifolium medium]
FLSIARRTGVLARRARTEHVVGKVSVNCASRRKDGASRQQMKG